MYILSCYLYVHVHKLYMHVQIRTCSLDAHMYMYIHITWSAWQANSKNLSTGCVCLYINLLKQTQLEFAENPAPSLSLPNGPPCPPKWLEYVYRTAHPVLCWLPTKLAEWIGENLQDELGFPDKADQRAEPGSFWTPAELHPILQSHVVYGTLTSFGCVEWESELCRGVMFARCYPHCFHRMNQKVK